MRDLTVVMLIEDGIRGDVMSEMARTKRSSTLNQDDGDGERRHRGRRINP
jgi:hypothetical protein